MYLTCNTVCDNIDWRKTTYYEIELFFVSAALIFEKCTRHSQCPANSGCRPSGCDGYTCRCDVNFVYSDDRSHCIPGMTYMYTYLCLSIIICVISSFLSYFSTCNVRVLCIGFKVCINPDVEICKKCIKCTS